MKIEVHGNVLTMCCMPNKKRLKPSIALRGNPS